MGEVLSIIDEMRGDWCKLPTNYYNQKRAEFEYNSYIRSAMNEIKSYLMEHKNNDPISLIEKFRHMMDKFACDSKNESAKFMFSVYYDIATDILDILLWAI